MSVVAQSFVSPGSGDHGEWGVFVILGMILLPCAIGVGLRLWDRRRS